VSHNCNVIMKKWIHCWI